MMKQPISIEDLFLKYEDQLAIIDFSERITYRELIERIYFTRRKLLNQSVQRGCTVVLAMDNDITAVVNFYALLTLNCKVVPCKPSLVLTEIDQMNLPSGAHYFIRREQIKYLTPKEQSSTKLTDEAPCILHLTSGSTGSPKLCRRGWEHLIREGQSYQKTLTLSREDRLLVCLPIYHSYALGFALFGGLISGSTLVMSPYFSPRDVWKQIERHKITLLPLVPVMARTLAQVYLSRNPDISTLRMVMVGAGACSKETIKHLDNRFGITVSSNYGSTETGAVVAGFPDRPADSIGKPMHGVEIQIRNGDKIADSHEPGEVWVRTGTMMSGYFGVKEQPFDASGFYPMGDLGYRDEEGYLFITGRIKSFVNIGGKKVNVDRVANVLLNMESIIDAHVYSKTRQSGEEMLIANIILQKEITVFEIMSYCKNMLDDYEIPSVIQIVEQIERNEMGKIVNQQAIPTS